MKKFIRISLKNKYIIYSLEYLEKICYDIPNSCKIFIDGECFDVLMNYEEYFSFVSFLSNDKIIFHIIIKE